MYFPEDAAANVGWGNSAVAWNLICLDAKHKYKSMKEEDPFFIISNSTILARCKGK